MHLTTARSFRLVARGGSGLACDDDGVALGAVSLVEASGAVAHAGRWRVRPIEELGEILRRAYGVESEELVRRCHRALTRVAVQLEAGDLALAALEAVLIGLPNLTSQALAKLASIADAEKAGTAWQDQPRVPTGQAGGGQWTTQGASSAGTGTVNPGICAPTRILRQLSPDDLQPVKGDPAPETPEVRLFENLAQVSIDETQLGLSASGRAISPQARGILIHALFEVKVGAALGLDHAETTYLNGKLVRRGLLGSSRADAVYGPLDRPVLAVEMKTGNAPLTKGQLRAYWRNLPPGTPLLVIRIEASK